MTPSSSRKTPLGGTRPEGTSDEREAARVVREMFSGIAPRYDFLNHVLSGSQDRLWRRRMAQRFRKILSRPDARVLDLCCGTGDLAFAFERAAGQMLHGSSGEFRGITGCDFAHSMLVCARRKAADARSGVRFMEADALMLPFADQTFDLVGVVFGFRNLTNYRHGLEEIHRVLRPGGTIAILEFGEPRSQLFGAIYRFYFEKILPRIGGAISGKPAAYAYLPKSVSKFPMAEELAAQIASIGFSEVSFESWTGGIVMLHVGRKK